MMTKREYKIGPRNSTVSGYPGRGYDWSKFCWDGSEIYLDDCGHSDHPKEERKPPLPYVDGCFIAEHCQYLHVPYDWAKNCTIYRVRPNESMWAGRIFRGLRVERQTTVKKEDGWYWILEGKL